MAAAVVVCAVSYGKPRSGNGTLSCARGGLIENGRQAVIRRGTGRPPGPEPPSAPTPALPYVIREP